MKTRRIAYWITTGLTAFVFLSGGAADLARPGFLMEGMTRLGYPSYFVIILGVWKLLGGVAILAPRLPRLKEWAYAGMVLDLIGAAASHAAVGDPAGRPDRAGSADAVGGTPRDRQVIRTREGYPLRDACQGRCVEVTSSVA
jgi:uncharacterized membrane protein YphA (DoxX/SURF4 family)